MCFIKNVSRHLQPGETIAEDTAPVLRLKQKRLRNAAPKSEEDPMFAKFKTTVQAEALMPR